MKNSNVILSIDDEKKKVLKLRPDDCSVLYYDAKGNGGLWALDLSEPETMTREEAIKAARAILEYYDEY